MTSRNEFERIKQYLEENNKVVFDTDNMEELISKLSIYHEELKVQNEELKRTEQTLLKSRERYKNLFMWSPIGYLTLDEDGIIQDLNESAAGLLDAAKGISIHRSIDEESQDNLYLFINRVNESGSASTTVDSKIAKTSSGNLLLIGKKLNEGSDEILCAVMDISARNELRESIIKLDALYKSSHAGAAYLNNKGIIVDKNEMLFEMTGLEAGRAFFDIACKDDRETLKELFNEFVSGKENHISEEIRIAGEGESYSILTIYKIDPGKETEHKYILTLLDITDKKKLEFEKLHLQNTIKNNQRLEAIDSLAGGIAHEINNPINGIMNYAQLMYDEPNDQKQVKEYSREIIYESERISQIVSGLLKFSKLKGSGYNHENINAIIEQTVLLMNTILKGDGIVINCGFDDEIGMVNCQRQEIQQVLMNMISNSRDALNNKYKDSHDDKIIYIKTQKVIIESAEYVEISILDKGTGIPDNIKEHIFDPFYTTKGRSLGTGLGLSISYGIVKNHKGDILLNTEPGEFTEFRILLPVIKAS